MIAPDGTRVYFTCLASGALFVNRHVVLEGKLPNRALPESSIRGQQHVVGRSCLSS